MPFCCFVTAFVIIVVIFVVVAAAVVVVGTYDSTYDFNVQRFYPVLLPQFHSVCQCHGTDVSDCTNEMS
jgi:hypothetical protein